MPPALPLCLYWRVDAMAFTTKIALVCRSPTQKPSYWRTRWNLVIAGDATNRPERQQNVHLDPG